MKHAKQDSLHSYKPQTSFAQNIFVFQRGHFVKLDVHSPQFCPRDQYLF